MSLRMADKCKFFLPEYAMFQKLAHANKPLFSTILFGND